MKTTAISFLLMALPAFLLADDNKDPELVKVYCFSEDLEAGFKDDTAAFVCRELGKRGEKKKSLRLVESREEATVFLEFLGTEQSSKAGETTYFGGGYAWRPDQLVTGARTLLTLGGYQKGFHAAGVGAQSTAGVAAKTEKWIRENRDTILEKAKAPQQ